MAGAVVGEAEVILMTCASPARYQPLLCRVRAETAGPMRSRIVWPCPTDSCPSSTFLLLLIAKSCALATGQPLAAARDDDGQIVQVQQLEGPPPLFPVSGRCRFIPLPPS